MIGLVVVLLPIALVYATDLIADLQVWWIYRRK